MQTQTRATKFLKPPSNPTNAAPQRRAAGRPKALHVDTFHSNCSTSFLNGLGGAHRSRILLHELGTRLLVAGCLLLGAGFLIKLDTTGPRGKFLIWNEGVLGAFERALPWSAVQLWKI